MSSGAAFQMRMLMDEANRVFLKVEDPEPDRWAAVARRFACEVDGEELLQMLGLAPYRSGPRRDHARRYQVRKRRQVRTHNVNGYKDGCRCVTCRQAMAEHREVYRPPIRLHGTETAYKNSGCRCEECRQAASAANRRRKNQLRSAA